MSLGSTGRRFDPPVPAGRPAPQVWIFAPPPPGTNVATLRDLMKESAGADPGEIDLQSDPFGRPAIVLPDGRPGPDVSISHASGALAISLYPGGQVGIDIEHVAATRPSKEVLEDTLTTDEQESLPTESVALEFCRLWTAKEAVLKALGQGLAVDPRQVEFQIEGAQLKLLAVCGTRSLAEGWNVSITEVDFQGKPGVLAVVWGEGPEPAAGPEIIFPEEERD